MNKKIALLIAGLISVAIVALGLLCDPASQILHSIVNLFSGGRSDIRVYLFFEYAAVLFFLAAWFCTKKNPLVNYQRFLPKKNTALWLTLGASFILQITAYFSFLSRFRFSIHDFVISFAGGEMSSNAFLHTHVLKGTFALFGQFFYNGNFQNLDAGTPFLSLMPHYWFYIGLLVLVATCILFLVTYAKYFYTIREKSVGFIIQWTALYAITTFTIIKNIYDGGFFNHETIPALLFLSLLLICTPRHNENEKRHVAYKKIHAVLICATFLLYPIFVVMGLFHTNSEYLSLVANSICFFLLFVVLHYPLSHKKYRYDRLGIMLIVLFLISTFYPLRRSLSVYTYRSVPISEKGAVLGLISNPDTPQFDIEGRPLAAMGNVGRLTWYRYPAGTPHTVGDLIRHYDLVDNYRPVSVAWKNCLPFTQNIEYSFILTTLRPFQENTRGQIVLKDATLTGFMDGLYRYQVKISIPQCVPRHPDVLTQYIQSQGQDTFFISSMKSGYGLVE